MTEVIPKSTAIKQSSNWERWFTFLTQTGIKNIFLDGIPQGYKTILASSFTVSVDRNQFGTTSKFKLFHGTVKDAISDVSASFWMHFWGDPNIDTPGQISFIIQ